MFWAATASGKGLLVEAVKKAFPQFWRTVAVGSFKWVKNNPRDPALDISWLLPVWDKRFALSSEASMANNIEIDKIKPFVSGGDSNMSRKCGGNELERVNRSTWFVLAQQLPSMAPCVDAATRNRIGAVFTFIPRSQVTLKVHLRSS